MPDMPDRPPPPALFDRELVARRYSVRPQSHPDFLTTLVLDDLAHRLGAIKRRFERAVILGPDARLLPSAGESAEGPLAFTRVGTLIEAPGILAFDSGGPRLPFDDCDLVVSVLDLQIVDDVPRYLAEIRRHMRPDGLFVGAVPGGNSLTELRRAWLAAEAGSGGGAAPRVAPMLDIRDAGRLLQHAGFALPVTDTETHLVRYPDPLALMREIKAMGAANPMRDRSPVPVTRGLLAKAVGQYRAIASDPDGRVRATLEIVWMSGWVPDRSQQKPLPPGSARTRLRDVLSDKSDG
jgi:SAM-dependent methyltransferase